MMRDNVVALWNEGQSLKAISAALNMPVGTVGSHIHHARHAGAQVRSGSQAGRKLTQIGHVSPAQRRILDLHLAGVRSRDIAERLGTTTATVKATISLLRRRLGEEVVPRKRIAPPRRDSRNDAIVAAWNSGMSTAELAQAFGVSVGNVRIIVHRQRWSGGKVRHGNRGTRMTAGKRDELVRLWSETKSLAAISRYLEATKEQAGQVIFRLRKQLGPDIVPFVYKVR